MSWECGCGIVNKDSTTVCRACQTPRGETWESIREHPERATPRAQAWKQLSDQIGAEFIVLGWQQLRPQCIVRARVKNWTITLDAFDPKYKGLVYMFYDILTKYGISKGALIALRVGFGGPHPHAIRMRAPYVRKDQFEFDIFRPGLLSRVRKLFRMLKSIKIEDPNFDGRFIVRSKDPSKARALLANINIRHLIRSRDRYPEEHIKVGHAEGFPEGVVTLYFDSELLVHSSIPDQIKELKSLFELFSETLNQLVAIESASEEPPVLLSHD